MFNTPIELMNKINNPAFHYSAVVHKAGRTYNEYLVTRNSKSERARVSTVACHLSLIEHINMNTIHPTNYTTTRITTKINHSVYTDRRDM